MYAEFLQLLPLTIPWSEKALSYKNIKFRVRASKEYQLFWEISEHASRFRARTSFGSNHNILNCADKSGKVNKYILLI